MIQRPVTYELEATIPPASFTAEGEEKPVVMFQIERTPIYRITDMED